MEQQKQEEYKRFKTLETAIREFQETRYGARYVGASLSKLEGENVWTQKVFEFMNKPKNILLFHGNPGIGKTYLCSALTEWALRTFNFVRYHTDGDLLRTLRKGISDGNGDYLIHLEHLIDDELVILDDVGSGINPQKVTYRDLEFRREVFFSFLDYRYNSRLPTIITSNFSKEEFNEVYSERISSRLFAADNTIITMFGAVDKRTLGM